MLHTIHLYWSAVRCPGAGGMRIGQDELRRELGQYIASPYLRPVEEESLRRSEAVDLFSLFELPSFGKCLISDGQTAQAGEVLAEGELAVHVERVQDRIAIVLLDGWQYSCDLPSFWGLKAFFWKKVQKVE